MTRRGAIVTVALAVVLVFAALSARGHRMGAGGPIRSTGTTPATVKPGTVLVVGDSLLFQSEVALGNAANRAGWKVVMDGRPGSGIAGGVSIGSWPQKIAEYVSSATPDVVVIELGTNGCRNCRSVAGAIDADLRPLADVPRVFWVNVRESAKIPPDPHAINDAIDHATDRWSNLQVIDMNAWFGGHPEWIQPDRTHFTARGTEQFAKIVMRAVSGAG